MKPSQNSSTTTPNATTQASPIFSNTYRQHIEPDTSYTNIQFVGLEPNTLYHFTFRVVLYEGIYLEVVIILLKSYVCYLNI